MYSTRQLVKDARLVDSWQKGGGKENEQPRNMMTTQLRTDNLASDGPQLKGALPDRFGGMDRLCNPNRFAQRRVGQLGGFNHESICDRRVNPAANAHHTARETSPAQIVVELARLGLDPATRLKVTLGTPTKGRKEC